jgi:NAD(P)-dependent dehydrogenase (short-subunit alcohol dehydrogenase family)
MKQSTPALNSPPAHWAAWQRPSESGASSIVKQAFSPWHDSQMQQSTARAAGAVASSTTAQATAAYAIKQAVETTPFDLMKLEAHQQFGESALARKLASAVDGSTAHAASKLALARFVRRLATQADWAGAGVRLNAIAPGAVRTPLLEEGLDDPVLGQVIRGFPIPLGGFGEPPRIAEAITFLLGPAASFCCGPVLYADGGSDALIRPDRH